MTICACASRFIPALRAVKAMLMSNISESLDAEQRSALWDIFFFVVPVVSTTLASFDRLFEGMGKESIGWLLLDEAGQATPQSASGAIWRACRSLIIGDPQQVEPVVTVPFALDAELRKRHDVNLKWSPHYESTQTLADRVMSYGAWMGEGDNRIWTGMPLRAHRRCASPMFEISNQIAYGGQMVQANKNPFLIRSVLGDSSWFNINGNESNGQVVVEEIEALKQLLLQLKKDWPIIVNNSDNAKFSLAKIFVISPFRKVATECRQIIAQLGLTKGEKKIACGTIHTFQGKEADIVFFSLGFCTR